MFSFEKDATEYGLDHSSDRPAGMFDSLRTNEPKRDRMSTYIVHMESMGVQKRLHRDVTLCRQRCRHSRWRRCHRETTQSQPDPGEWTSNSL